MGILSSSSHSDYSRGINEYEAGEYELEIRRKYNEDWEVEEKIRKQCVKGVFYGKEVEIKVTIDVDLDWMDRSNYEISGHEIDRMYANGAEFHREEVDGKVMSAVDKEVEKWVGSHTYSVGKYERYQTVEGIFTYKK